MKEANGITKLWNFLGMSEKARDLKKMQKELLNHSNYLNYIESDRPAEGARVDKPKIKIRALNHSILEVSRAAPDDNNTDLELKGELLHNKLQEIEDIKKTAQSSIISRIALFLGKGEESLKLKEACIAKQHIMSKMEKSIADMLMEDANTTDVTAPFRGSEAGIRVLVDFWNRECNKLGIDKLAGASVNAISNKTTDSDQIEKLAKNLLQELIDKLNDSRGSAIQELAGWLYTSVCVVQSKQDKSNPAIVDPKAFVVLTFMLRTFCPMILSSGLKTTSMNAQANKIGEEKSVPQANSNVMYFAKLIPTTAKLIQTTANQFQVDPKRVDPEFRSLFQNLENALLPEQK